MSNQIGRLKKAVFFAIPILTITVLGVVATEVTLRLMRGNWTQAQYLNVLRDRQIKYNLADLYPSETGTSAYTRDSYGLRGGCKNPADIDILTIGGSTTDQKMVDDALTYQQRMQAILSDHYARPVCVSNAGVDGHSSYGHIGAFDHWFPLIDDLGPSVVLLYVGINDATFERIDGNAAYFENREDSGLKATLKKLEIVNALLRVRNIARGYFGRRPWGGRHMRIEKGPYPATAIGTDTEELAEINAQSFEERFTQILAKIDALGARPLCVSQPHFLAVDTEDGRRGIESSFEFRGQNYSGLDYDYSLQRLNDVMLRLCGKGNFVDLYSHRFDPAHFYDYTHTTDEGARIVGEVLAEQVIDLGLLDETAGDLDK